LDFETRYQSFNRLAATSSSNIRRGKDRLLREHFLLLAHVVLAHIAGDRNFIAVFRA